MPESALQHTKMPRTAATVSAIVLAAGASVRMGGVNKLLLPLAERPLIACVVDAVSRARIGELVVVTGYESERLRAALADRDVVFAHNPAYARGMASSIGTGIRAASRHSSGYMICLSDLPMVTTSEYDAVIGAFDHAIASDPHAIVRPVYRGQPGHPVILAAAYRAEIAAPSATTTCRNIVNRHPASVREIEWATDHVVRDADTRAAYAGLVAKRAAGA